jgi:exopolysaccharide biosynthesis polyprenyl glycosylphosphotransferase
MGGREHMNAVDTIERPSGERAEPAGHSLRLRDGQQRWLQLCLLVDGLMLAAAAALERASALAGVSRTVSLAWLLAMPLVTLAVLAARGAYRSRLRLDLVDDLRLIIGATSVVAMAFVTLRVLLSGDASVAYDVLRQWVFSVVYLSAGRVGLSVALSRARRSRETAIPTLIVGAGAVGRLVARRLQERPEIGFRPVGYLDTQPLPSQRAADDLPVISGWDVSRALHDLDVAQVLIAFSTAPSSIEVEIVRACNRAGVPVAYVPRLFEAVAADLEVEYIGGLPLMSLRPTNPRSWRFTLKYALDRLVVALALLVIWPVLAAIAIAVWVSLGRPILFRQIRAGVDGKPFAMLKFRTMREGGTADELLQLPEDIAPGGVEGDDRRTPVGRFLRRTSLDELPQLFNVLRGEMSLVGPRPERPEFVRRFEQSIHRYGERHRVKAGITGWAQIAGLRGNTSLHDRVEWDNWYIENWTPWLDVKIVLMTVGAIFRAEAE